MLLSSSILPVDERAFPGAGPHARLNEKGCPMSAMLTRKEMVMALMPATTAVPPFQLCIIALTAFLTVVDLFATQALLPALTTYYQVTPAAMGLAVNACTLGMAIGGLAVALGWAA